MKLYIAGNFPQMNSPGLEKECYNIVTKQMGEYCRLVSYFFKDGAECVINTKKEIENAEAN